VLSKSETRELYDRYGHAGLRGGGFTPSQFDLGNLADIFSAFFGDDLFGAPTRGRGRVRGEDVAAEVAIDLVEAASGATREVPVQVSVACDRCDGSGAELGTEMAIPTLQGDVTLRFDPGTQPGEIRVLRGQGMPVLQGFGRGDHRVLVNVAVPRRLSEEQRTLLEEFDRRATEENYREDEG